MERPEMADFLLKPPNDNQMTTNMKKYITTAALIATAATAQAALIVTNGGFGTVNKNGGTVHNGGWFESGTANWVEGSWAWGGQILLLMDGGGATGYLYQSLGTVDQAEIDLGSLQITADFAEKTDGTTNTAVFDFYVGNFTGATVQILLAPSPVRLRSAWMRWLKV